MEKINKHWKSLTDNYDYFLLDLWGVLIDGEEVFPSAIQFLKYLNSKNKEIVFLSNTPDRAQSLAKRLDLLGITQDLYNHIISSGEAVQKYLKHNSSFFGKDYLIIGDTHHQDLLKDFDLNKKNINEPFDFVILTSFDESFSKLSNLEKLQKSKTPFFCVNPDIFITTLQGEKKYCAGEIARRYEEINGPVEYIGKPYPYIFKKGIEVFTRLDYHKTVMIGDNINTDILGASNFGIDCALVNNSESSEKATYHFKEFTY